MTHEELLNMRVGTVVPDVDIGYSIIRVPGGWIYAAWDIDTHVDSGVYVPEPQYFKPELLRA